MTKLSVIICAHNPRPDYLKRVLGGLQCQKLAKDQWQLLLIDNASKPPLASAWDLSWHPNARHIYEPELGLSVTRNRGIMEADAELLVFVDDDNVLDSDYLSEVLRIESRWPILGLWGSGCIVPDFGA